MCMGWAREGCRGEQGALYTSIIMQHKGGGTGMQTACAISLASPFMHAQDAPPCTPPSRPTCSARASMRSTANSAHSVLPEPVGAATRALSSVLYSALNACVWMGLNVLRPLQAAQRQV